MIWRISEGDRLRCGLNWSRDARTPLAVMLAWQTCTRFYTIGFRCRLWGATPLLLWRPLRSSCLFCDVARDIHCAKHFWDEGFR